VKGDKIVVEEHHLKAAARIAPLVLPRIRAKSGRFVMAVAGESGSGKSETARALAVQLTGAGLQVVILGQDDYFVLPPRSNDERRRADPDWLGPHVEVRMDLLDENLRHAVEGRHQITKPLVDYDANTIGEETISLEGVQVVMVEGTYTSLLRHVDSRIFIARSRLETLAHRRKRNRGSEAADPFIEQILEIEHKIIAGHRHLADYVITRDHDVLVAP
jgi:uridine kinase